MIDQVQVLGSQICEWYTAPYLLFSGNVFSNLIYYSHLLPAIVAVLFGTLIFLSNRKALINKVLFFVMIMFTLWSLIDLVLWATERVHLIMFFWSVLAYIEPLIYFGCFYLVSIFVNREDLSFRSKLLSFCMFLPILVLAPTAFNLTGFDFTNCEREAIEGPLWNYIYILEFVAIVIIAFIGARATRKTTDKKLQRQHVLITIGTILFLLALSFGNIIGNTSLDWSIAQYGLFGMPIFIVILSYLVVRYQRFNTKVFATQILTSALSVLILSLLLIEDITLIRIVTIFTFVVSVGFGYLLILSVIKEVRQRKEIEQLAENLEHSNLDLAEANDKLKGLDKLKTEFLSLASHQLRSPLTAIKGYASMLTEGSFGKMDEKQDVAVKRIYTSAQGLVSIVEDLLNVSKIEQGGMKYEFMTTELSKSVTDLYNEMKIPAESKGLELTLDIPPYEKFIVNADPTKLKQVFLNLTDNSIKYTPKGFVKLSLRHEGSNIVFAVSDNGVGISPETMGKLFGKFNRGEGGKLNTGGSGLGLYLAREIARAHKGDIVIESEGLGKGSTFKVVIPAVASQTPGSVIAS